MLKWLVHWAFPSFVLLGSLAYAVLHVRDASFVTGTVGNLLATLVGVLVGVPIALEVENTRRNEESIAAEQRDRVAECDTLELLLGEVQGNVGRMEVRQGMEGNIPLDPLLDSRWRALVAAGMLRHVRSARLLAALSDAYRLTALIAETEKRIQGAIFGINVSYPDGETAATKMLVNVRRFHPAAIEALTLTISLLQTRLTDLRSGVQRESA
jgi:hypothetical protein